MVKRTARLRGGAKTRRGGAKTRRGAPPNLNITSPSQFKQLASVLGKNPVVLVFVYADWCGHCQRFKPDWKKVSNTPARNMPTIAIRDDVFKNSPLNNLVTPEGYPTVAVASAANNVSVNLPTREPNALTNVVKNANVLAPSANNENSMNETVKNVLNNNMSNNNISNNNMSNNNNLNSSPRSSSSNNNNNSGSLSNYNLNNELPLAMQKSTPPKTFTPVNRDTIEPPMSEEAYLENNEVENELTGANNNKGNMNQLGGGLFEQLLRRGRVA